MRRLVKANFATLRPEDIVAFVGYSRVAESPLNQLTHHREVSELEEDERQQGIRWRGTPLITLLEPGDQR
jgi:hypothetical protein